MVIKAPVPLLVGEISVDVTVTPHGQEQKLRLGGIAHAARGFWASGKPFAVAAVVPHFLEDSAKRYFASFGCSDFCTIGYITGAPNVTLVFDPTEAADQEYDALLRDEKSVALCPQDATAIAQNYTDILIFPGSFDLGQVCNLLDVNARLHIDVAYDVGGVDTLRALGRSISTIFISTSSTFFVKIGSSGIDELARNFAALAPSVVILKENRGGSRLRDCKTGDTHSLPAQLSTTVNSVGVGDVFAATYIAHLVSGPLEAGMRATYASSAYAQTTDPDAFAAMVKRDARLSLQEMIDLGGTALPWEVRQRADIYLAAPDFVHTDRRAIERAVSSLRYHNFKVRRPVQENGELPTNSDALTLDKTYRMDVALLDECKLLFAVPTGKDPGTLVEIGLAIAKRIPVVVYDPDRECANTMVIAGSDCYSADLDACLNAVFVLLSKTERVSDG